MKWYEESKVSTRVVDDAFTQRFFQRLQETHDFDEYRQWVAEETRQQEILIKNLTKQLQQIDTQQDVLLQEIVDIRTSIKEKIRQGAHLADEDQEKLKQRLEAEATPLIEKLRNRFNALEKPKAELMQKLPKAEDTEHLATARQFLDFQTEVQKLVPLWEKKPFTTRMEFVNLFVQQAILTAISPHWIQLDIHWSHPTWEGDRLYIHRQRGASPQWTNEEREIVKASYAIASQQELLVLLPDKSWKSIRKQANDLGLARPLHTSLEVPHSLTWQDIQFMQEKGIALDDPSTKYEPLVHQQHYFRGRQRRT